MSFAHRLMIRRSALLMLVPAAQLCTEPAFAASGPAATGLAAGITTAATTAVNPAALTMVDGRQIEMHSIVGYSDSQLDFVWNDEPLASNDTSGAFAIPALHFAAPINDRTVFGFSFSGTFGMNGDYGDEWLGRYIMEEWTLVNVAATPGIGFKVTDALSLGASVSANYTAYQMESAVLNLEPNSDDGRMKLDVSDIAFSFSAAALYEVSDATRFGFSYRSKVSSEASDEPTFKGIGPLRQILLDNSGIEDTAVSMDMSLPAAAIAGVWHKFDNGLEVTLDGVWVNFSDWNLSQTNVSDDDIVLDDTQYDDIWGGTTSVTWPFSEKWSGTVGAAYFSSAVSDEARSLLLTVDRIISFGVGAKWKVNDRRTLQFNFSVYDTGSSPFATDDIPLAGQISGDYSAHQTYVLDISHVWRF